MQNIILYLLIILLVFLIMISVNEKGFNLSYIKALPFGKYTVKIIEIIIKLWSKTSTMWIYVILGFIILCMLISIWSLSLIVNHLK